MSDVVVGTVVCDVPLSRATLRVDGARHQRTTGGRFQLLLDDGTHVDVTADPEVVDVADGAATRAPWGELAEDARATAFADVAPGDHVKVELGGWIVASGDRIAVRGERAGDALRAIALASAREGEAAARAAVESRSDAPAPTPRAPEPPRARVPREIASIVLLVLGAGAAAVGIARSGSARWAAPMTNIGLFALMAGLAMVLARPYFGGVIDRRKKSDVGAAREKYEPPWDLGVVVLGVAAVVVLGMAGATYDKPNPRAHGIVTAIAGLVPALWIFAFRRPWLRLAGLVLARGFPATCTTEAFRYSVTFTKRREERQVNQRGSDGNTRLVNRTVRWVEGTPSLWASKQVTAQTPDGTKLRIATGGALWLAPIRFEPTTGVGRLLASIDVGDDLVILGRAKDGELRATGPESLVMFGARAHARPTLRRLLLTWYATFALVIGLAAFAIVLPLMLR